MSPYAGALEAVDEILDRGGEADDVLRDVLRVLHEQAELGWAAIRFAENGELVDGPSVGTGSGGLVVPVLYEGREVGELEADATADRAFLERVAILISAHVLVGWDTGGASWNP